MSLKQKALDKTLLALKDNDFYQSVYANEVNIDAHLTKHCEHSFWNPKTKKTGVEQNEENSRRVRNFSILDLNVDSYENPSQCKQDANW